MAVEDDIARKQARIDFLKKSRPNDPEIAKRQAEIKALKAQPAAPAAPAPAPTSAAPSPFENGNPIAPPTFGSGPSAPTGGAPAAPAPSVPAPAPAYTPPPTPNYGGVDPTKFGDVANAAKGAADEASYKNGIASNPNQEGPFGSHNITIGPDGRPIIKDELTGLNKDLYGAEGGLDLAGAVAGGKLLAGYPQDAFNTHSIDGTNPIPTANSADRTKVEDAVYSKLTQDLDKNYARNLESTKQELANRGIPFNSPQYNDQITRLADQHQRAQTEARSQAVSQGGQELSTQFGLGLQSHQQALSDYTSNYTTPAALAGQLENIGQGYQTPSYQGYQGSPQAPVDVGGIAGQIASGKLQQQQIDDAKAEATRQFKEDVKEFGQTIATQKYIANLSAATARIKASSGGGGGTAASTDPTIGGQVGATG